MIFARRSNGFLFWLFVLFTTPVFAWTNDLKILSIRRTNDCTTLMWKSHAGEFYNVYWASNLNGHVFWRVAAVHVPSQGTNTTWSECEPFEGGMMMMGGFGGGESLDKPAPTLEEVAERYEANRPAYTAWILYLEELLQQAMEGRATRAPFMEPTPVPQSKVADPGGGAQTVSGPLPPPGGGGGSGTNALAPSYKFYRIARVAARGFVDGWGRGFGPIPTNLTNAISVSAGPYDSGAHNLALRANGTVTAWGNNNFGQCNVPANLSNVIAISTGGRHSIAAKRDGSVVVWGNNSFGQITNAPTNLTHVIDVKAGLWHNLALTSNGTVFAWGDLFNRSNAVPAGLSNVTAIAAGPRHCLALKHDGTVKAWGFDYDFLGNFLPTNVPANLSNVLAISAGMEHNQALLKNGTLVVWGKTNNFAISRLPSGLTNLLGSSAGWHSGMAWDVLSTNLSSWGTLLSPSGLHSVVAGSAGFLHALAIITNNLLPVIRRQPSDAAAPVGHATNISVFATSDLPLSYQWQKNGVNLPGQTYSNLSFPSLQDADDGYYRVGISNAVGQIWSRQALVQTIHPPVITNQSPAPDIRLAFDVDTNAIMSVAVSSKGATPRYQWYHNGQPNLTIISATSRVTARAGRNGEGDRWVVVSNPAGSVTSQVWKVTITMPGEFAGWGDNTYNQIRGIRHETNLIQVAAGNLHSLALRENGTVLAWGDNLFGQTNLPASLTNVVAVAAGFNFSLALKDDGTVVGWGLNDFGQTQPPVNATNLSAIAAGRYHSLALTRAGTVIGWGDASYGALNIPVGLTNVMQIAAGHGLSYALLSNGTVRAWGSGGLGAVTIPPTLSNVVEIAAGYSHLLALKDNGTVVALGTDSGWGETLPPGNLSNVMHVAAGYFFSLALLNNGTVRGWGRTEYGETNVPAWLGDTKSISAGDYHALALAYSGILMYNVDVSRDLLMLYNTNSQDSITVKDHYLRNRPAASGASAFGLNCRTVEQIGELEFTNDVRTPVLNWLSANPTKRPEYVILLLDVPSRVTNHPGVAFALRAAMPRLPKVTSINMGAVGTNDCIGYINKLKAFGDAFSPGNLWISPSRSGYSNTNWYSEDKRPNTNAYQPHGLFVQQALLAASVSTSAIHYVSHTEPYIARATNVAGYFSWGTHNAVIGSDYAIDGSVVFTNDSGWVLFQTAESVNGQRYETFQGTFIDWFSHNAFGGINYSHTPVGGITHVGEPHSQTSPDYFAFWAMGKNFGICAWGVAPRQQFFQAIGDPFTRR